MQQNILCLSSGNSIVQQSKVQSQTWQSTHTLCPQEKFFAIPLSGNVVVNRSLLFELELNKYLDITTSKAQIISAFVTSCLLVPMFIVVCFEDNASLEFPTSFLNNWESSLNRLDFNEQVSVFNETIMNIMSNIVPNKLITCGDRDPPWMNRYIKKVIVAINYFHKKFVLPSSNTGNLLMFKNLQNQLIQSIHTAKQVF